MARLAAPDTGATPASTRACAQIWTDVDCSAASVADRLPACQPKLGKRAIAQACGDDAQCQTGYCRAVAAGTCGTCAPRAQVGQPCNTNADCADDMACVATTSTKKCKARVLSGGACDTSPECVAPATCVGGKCADPAALGAACDTFAKNCDAGMGAFCHDSKQVCAAYQTAAEGKPCGYFSGDFIVCSAGSTCVLTGGGQGACEPIPKAGQSCTASEKVPCVAGLTCNSGVCAVPNPGQCL